MKLFLPSSNSVSVAKWRSSVYISMFDHETQNVFSNSPICPKHHIWWVTRPNMHTTSIHRHCTTYWQQEVWLPCYLQILKQSWNIFSTLCIIPNIYCLQPMVNSIVHHSIFKIWKIRNHLNFLKSSFKYYEICHRHSLGRSYGVFRVVFQSINRCVPVFVC